MSLLLQVHIKEAACSYWGLIPFGFSRMCWEHQGRPSEKCFWPQGKVQREDEELSKTTGKLLQKLYERQNEAQFPLVKELLKVQGAISADGS